MYTATFYFTEDVDYEAFETRLIFEPAILRRCVNVTILDDNAFEGPPETFSIGLALVPNGGPINVVNNFITYSITESDCKDIAISCI